MALDIGTISLIATIDTSKYKKGAEDIEKTNKEIEDSTDRTDKSVNKTNSGFVRLAKRGLKVATVGMLGLGTAVTAMTLKGGFARALNIEDAQAKLRGLGHDAKSVRTIMNNALTSVRGTAYGLDSAATTAANAVASGIRPGKQLEQVLKTVANTASLAGRDMSELGAIFNKVAASNKVQMDVINQLHDAGIPALALLSKEMGKSAEETAKMASAGKINFETFERAMRKGVGDAAIEMGNTTRGSLANMRAAFSRAGAIIADKILPHLRDSIQGITGWVDGVAQGIPGIIDTIISQFSRISDGLTDVGGNFDSGNFKAIGETVGSGIANGLNNAIKGIKVSLDAITGWFSGIDWGKLGIEVGSKAIAFALGFVIGLMDIDWGSIWNLLVEHWFGILVGLVGILFSPSRLVGPLAKVLSKIPFGKLLIRFILKPIRNLGAGVRSAFGDLFAGAGKSISSRFGVIGNVIKTLGKIISAPFRIILDGIERQIRLLPLSIQQAFTGTINFIKALLGGFLNIIKTIFSGIWTVITTIMRPLSAFFSNLFRGIWAHIRGIFSGVGPWFGEKFLSARLMIQNAIGGIVNWFVGRWAAIKSVYSKVPSWFGDKFSGAWEAIKRAFSKVGVFFGNLWNTISAKFGDIGTKIGDKIGGAFKKVINQVIRGAVNIINGFIRAINGAIDIINNIPKVNIGKLGELNVPQLAKGGIVTSPTLAMIGEGGEAEAVIPLSKLDKMLENNTSDSSQDNQPVVVNLRHSKGAMRQAALDTIELVNEVYRSKGIPQIGVRV